MDAIPRADRLQSLTEGMRAANVAMHRLGAASHSATSASDQHLISEHDDLHALGLELNNLYGNAFGD